MILMNLSEELKSKLQTSKMTGGTLMRTGGDSCRMKTTGLKRGACHTQRLEVDSVDKVPLIKAGVGRHGIYEPYFATVVSAPVC